MEDQARSVPVRSPWQQARPEASRSQVAGAVQLLQAADRGAWLRSDLRARQQQAGCTAAHNRTVSQVEWASSATISSLVTQIHPLGRRHRQLSLF